MQPFEPLLEMPEPRGPSHFPTDGNQGNNSHLPSPIVYPTEPHRSQQLHDHQNYNSLYPLQSQSTMYQQPSYYPPQPYYMDSQHTHQPNNPYNYGYQQMQMPQPFFKFNTFKTIELRQGNYIVEIPVADKIIQKMKNNSGPEFSHLRYTAVIADPNNYSKKGYALKQVEMERSTELFVVITMYNEDVVLFNRTWKAVMKNIAYLCSRNERPWRKDSWKRVIVSVVSDGRNNISKRTLIALGLLGVYQDGIIKTSINGEDVNMHLFEYTTQLYVDSDFTVKLADVPVQIIFALKEKNKKKINSHRWFFNAFSNILQPKICILIDVGTKPSDKSFYHLCEAFYKNEKVAGATGEIYCETGKLASKLLNPLVAAQNFEYKISNILDKPFESVFGFIAVLPGAFSAYRYQALLNGPLEKYFLGEDMVDATISRANMYLAEDRILCFELVTKAHESYVLKYVRKARAETDVPNEITEFIVQRRRWLNGSFFAALHAQVHFYQIFRSSHSFGRKIALIVQMLYNLVNLIFSWFGLGNMFLVFYILSNSVIQSDTSPFSPDLGIALFIGFQQLYLIAIIIVFIASLGNRPSGTKWLYMSCFFLFSIIMVAIIFLTGWTIYQVVPHTVEEWAGITNLILDKPTFRNLVLSVTTTYGVYFIVSFLYLEPYHMFNSFIQYLIFIPSFVNIIQVYAFCNIHDISWGTKAMDVNTNVAPVSIEKDNDGNAIVTTDMPTDQSDINAVYEIYLKALLISSKRKLLRTRVLILWVFSNTILIVVMTTPVIAVKIGLINTVDGLTQNMYLTLIFWMVAGLSTFRFIGSLLYLIIK